MIENNQSIIDINQSMIENNQSIIDINQSMIENNQSINDLKTINQSLISINQ